MSNKLGLKIKQLRSEISLENGKKFTQSDLAKALNISRSYLGDIESGRTSPNNNLLKKISNFFNIDISDLTSLEANENIKEVTEISNMNIMKSYVPDINDTYLEDYIKNSELNSLISNLLKLNDDSSIKLLRSNIEKLSEYEELEFKKINNLPLNKISLESNAIKSQYSDSYYDLLIKKILLLLDLEGKKSERLLNLKQNSNSKSNIINEATPIAAHDKKGTFSKEDFIHDENIMDDDDFWNT